MYAKLNTLPALLALLALGSAAHADDTLQTRVDETIRPLMAEHAIAGMAVAITHNGQAHYFNYGVARLDDPQPVSSDTLFEIGSLSKPLTATLAALAQATGKLTLADSAGQHWPELQGSQLEHASLLNLGTYTAGGLPLQFPDNVTDPASMLAYYRQWQPEYAAGTHRRYSNPSIGLLGMLAAKSMGQPFSTLMEGTLFPALGMSHSYIQVPTAQLPRYAFGYSKDNQPLRVTPTRSAWNACKPATPQPWPWSRNPLHVSHHRKVSQATACSIKPAQPAASAPMRCLSPVRTSAWSCWPTRTTPTQPESKRPTPY